MYSQYDAYSQERTQMQYSRFSGPVAMSCIVDLLVQSESERLRRIAAEIGDRRGSFVEIEKRP